MYLNKFNLVSNKEKRKFNIDNFQPFSFFKVTKIKNDFSKKLLEYKEKEKNFMSLFGIKTLSNSKMSKRNKNSGNKIQKSMSSASVLSSLNEILSLNHEKKTSMSLINQVNIDFHKLPKIQRSLRRFKTNLSINTNNINNNKFDNMTLRNMIKENKKIQNKQINSTKNILFITDIKDNNPINQTPKHIKTNINSYFILNESLIFFLSKFVIYIFIRI